MAKRFFFLVILSLLLSQCDFFGTQPFQPAPLQTIQLECFPPQGKTWAYTLEEALDTFPEPANRPLKRGALLAIDTLKIKGLGVQNARAASDSGSTPKECSEVEREVVGEGTQGGRRDTLCLVNGDRGFLALFTRIGAGETFLPAMGEDSLNQNGHKTFLPVDLESPSTWQENAGVFHSMRTLTHRDTLLIGNKLEETFRIQELITLNGSPIGHHQYWYGKMGLIAAEQRFNAMEILSESGEVLGQAIFFRRLQRLP